MNRRDFFKMLGVAGAATVLPLPALASGQTASLEISEVIIDEVAIDAPVTSDTPFAWIEIDGVRYAVRGIDVRQRNTTSFVEMRVSVFGLVDPGLIYKDGIRRVSFSIPGSVATYSSGGRVDAVSMLAFEYEGIETDISMTLMGPLIPA